MTLPNAAEPASASLSERRLVPVPSEQSSLPQRARCEQLLAHLIARGASLRVVLEQFYGPTTMIPAEPSVFCRVWADGSTEELCFRLFVVSRHGSAWQSRFVGSLRDQAERRLDPGPIFTLGYSGPSLVSLTISHSVKLTT